MVDKVLKVGISILGVLLGFALSSLLRSIEILKNPLEGWPGLLISVAFSLLLGIIFYILSSRVIKKGKKLVGIIENELQKLPAYEIILGSVGLIIGLVIAYLISQPISGFNKYLGIITSIILYGVLGYLGIKIATKKAVDITNTISSDINFKKTTKDKLKQTYKSCPKILDTSVIIDGRIADICKTGFIEGPLVIPMFVLEELQHIADSSDGLKRNRGRRGLDILNKIQKELDIEIIIHEKKFDDIQEVDSKLLKLTQQLKGKIITNDYNLNKVAEVQKIDVLNINELANAVKPVVLPGEEMIVQVVRDGKESGQGLAYLDDGTMIVVESGRKYIGETIDVLVTSVLQTSAGRMIFAKPKALVDKAV
ncbi:PIN/TRAM domain-containing protein [Tissierella sp. Yu-01]|uniref:PIN/TRAM domain-containing protein n=1 Tax=Tissierella sp. Yu-01 TaxID=3035694 RepID=UPI00240DFA47|nr:PIN/TRAM domain-containing protein [Tissierella sp. Yu-01]WFA07684.1 PIN/TRAM domain-containing protein [Tissierella sp. Yu-01]